MNCSTCWHSPGCVPVASRNSLSRHKTHKCYASFNQKDAWQSAPLLDAVLERGNRLQDKPFHVPGHKRGRALDPGMCQLLGLQPGSGSSSSQQQRNPLQYDLTELAGLDYLSSPTGVIAAAQQAGAATFGADHTWLLVNGCSAGIHAAVMATVRPGQALLLARNCHLSAFAACVLAGCRPVWLQPEEDALHGVAHCVTPQQLEAGFRDAQQQGLEVAAVLVVSPTYYGAVARVPELAALCHERGVPLLVDEAHGGHLAFLQQHREELRQQEEELRRREEELEQQWKDLEQHGEEYGQQHEKLEQQQEELRQKEEELWRQQVDSQMYQRSLQQQHKVLQQQQKELTQQQEHLARQQEELLQQQEESQQQVEGWQQQQKGLQQQQKGLQQQQKGLQQQLEGLQQQQEGLQQQIDDLRGQWNGAEQQQQDLQQEQEDLQQQQDGVANQTDYLILQQETLQEQQADLHSRQQVAAGQPAAGQPSSSSSSLSALAAGADLVAQSSHKVLSAMTQAAMLHSQGSRVDPARVSKALQVLQTSSPSYLLLASLDAARRHAATPGTWDTPLAVAAAARAGLAAIPGLLLLQGGSCGSEASVGGWDPLRLVVNVAGLGLSGFDAAQWLEEQHSIVPELATAQLVVLVVGPGSVMGDAEALLHGFDQLSKLHHAPHSAAAASAQQPDAGVAAGSIQNSTAAIHSSSKSKINMLLPVKQTADNEDQPISQQQQQQQHDAHPGPSPMSPRDAFFAPTQTVPLAAAAGRISAELLCPYPPGVPLVFPGELLTQRVLAQLTATLAAGGVVTGAADATLQTLLVVAEQQQQQQQQQPGGQQHS